MEIDESLIDEAMKDKGIPAEKKKEFKLYLADDVWDWISENARSFAYDLFN